MTELEALIKAVEKLDGQTAMAAKLSKRMDIHIRQGHVWKWINECKRLPEKYVMHVECLTRIAGDTVFAHELCPASFPINTEY